MMLLISSSPYKYGFLITPSILFLIVTSSMKLDATLTYPFQLQSSNGGFSVWEPQRAYRWLEVRTIKAILTR